MQYLYYRLWQLLIGKSEEDMPPFGAMMIFCMLFIFNLRTIELLINHFYNISFTHANKEDVILYSFIPIFSVLIFNTFYFFRRRNKIKLKYENESLHKKIVGTIVVLTYAISSTIILFIVGNEYPIQ